MGTEPRPDSGYTRTWSPSGEVEYAMLENGTHLRYLKTGSGPTALILLHTVRTQLDHFQLVIPSLMQAYTVRGRHARHGLVRHHPERELHRAGAAPCARRVRTEAGPHGRDPGWRVDGGDGVPN